MGTVIKSWTPSDTYSTGGHSPPGYQTTRVRMNGKADESKITVEIRKAQAKGENTERALAAEIIRYKKALRSHSDPGIKMTGEYLETRNVASRLKTTVSQ